MTTQVLPDTMSWARAREVSYEAGRAAGAHAAIERRPLVDCDGATLAEDLRTPTDLPAFPTSTVDGWAVRGPAPWRITGRVLAGSIAPPLGADGVCVEIATGAMVPVDAEAVLRVEESAVDDGRVTGTPRPEPEWRRPGDEASRGDLLLPAGTPVTPGIIGLAAASGLDTLPVRPRPRAAMLVFGDELLTAGPPGDGRVRDSLGPQIPGWLARVGVTMARPVLGPIEDTREAHVEALRAALTTGEAGADHSAGVDLILTTGGTMNGPVDHLHPALAELGATYAVNTVEVRPGFPMLLATLTAPDGRRVLLGGLPGNPQSAVVAFVSLVVPALAGLTGRPLPALPPVRLAAPIAGKGNYTHLSLVRLDAAGTAVPVSHVASSMLRGLAQSSGFAVIAPGTTGGAGDEVPFAALPVFSAEVQS